jgi:hypothetical protein
MIGDEMRLGKTRTCIAGAEALYRAGLIDDVVVVAPATPAKDVWFHPQFGQIAAYSTEAVTVLGYFSGREKRWTLEGSRPLRWLITNYELIRRPERLTTLLKEVGPKTLLILDESIAVAGHGSQQTKAVFKLRRRCGRVVELNGTPWGDNPGSVYAQFKILDPAILGCTTWYDFVARYGVMGGYRALKAVRKPDGSWKREMAPMQIVRWVNLDDLSHRTAPFVLRRTMKEVYPEMPRPLDPAVLTVTLTEDTWKIYKEMRDNAVAKLSEGVVSAAQAGVKMLRLRQITAGFLGGIEGCECSGDGYGCENPSHGYVRMTEVGREKLDAILGWVSGQLADEPAFKCILWCAYRKEAERLAGKLSGLLPAHLLYGQSHADREVALRVLDPRTAGAGPAALVGLARAGGFGLNFAAASSMLYASNEASLVVREQSEARILGPDQKRAAAYTDVVAEGPKGQKTVDHVLLKLLRGKRDVASLTAAEWISEVSE